MEKDSIFGLVILLIPLAFWNYDLNPFSDGTNVYMQKKECLEESPKNCKWKNHRQLVYYVDKEENKVKYWDSSRNSFIEITTECTIVDDDNWNCYRAPLKGLYDGEPMYILPGYKQVGGINWWLKS